MDKEKLADAICEIDSRLIESTFDRRTAKRNHPFSSTGILATAACIALVAGISLVAVSRLTNISSDGINNPETTHNDVEAADGALGVDDSTIDPESRYSVTVPPIKIEAGGFEYFNESQGYFAYGGQIYLQNQILYDDCAFGEKLGAVQNIFADSPPYDYYGDFSGNFNGDVYTVEGFPTEYMLGVKTNGKMWTYTCMHGVTYETAADLFDYRIGLSRNYNSFLYSLEDTDSTARLNLGSDANQAIFLDFAEALYEAELISATQRLKLSEETYIGSILCKTSSGIEVVIGLHEGGYVSTHYVVAKMDNAPFDNFVSLLDKREFDYFELATYIAPPDMICTSLCKIADGDNKYLYFYNSQKNPLTVELFYFIGDHLYSSTGTVKRLEIPHVLLEKMRYDTQKVIYSRNTQNDGFSCEFILCQSDSQSGEARYLLYSNEDNATFYRWVNFNFVRLLTESEVNELRESYPESFVPRQ